MLGGIVMAVAAGFLVAERKNQETEDTMPNTIEPMEARKWVQKHLEETRGKRKVYIANNQFEAESYHERTQPVFINGEKHYIYGIVGKPQHPVSNEPEAGFVRQVFDLTEVTSLKYDNELPRVMEDEIKVDPLADISNITEAEGRLTNDDMKQDKGNTVINVENKETSNQNRQNEDILADVEEDEYGSVEK